MRTSYKWHLLIALVASMVIAAACGGETGGGGEGAATNGTQDAAEGQPITLNAGHVWPEDDYQAKAVATFAEEVNERTEGNVTINVAPAGQLGGDRSILEGLEIGTNDIWVGGCGVLNAITPVGLLFPAPFMFDSLDQAMATYNGEIGNEVKQRIDEDTQTKTLAFWARAPRHLTLDAPAETPSALSGKKIRVPENPMFIQTWEALGAAPTPMAFTDVFTALQQGTINGQENPLVLIESAGLYQVQSHLMLTKHVIEPLCVSISSNTWQNLSADQQEAIQQAANGNAKEQMLESSTRLDEDLRQTLEEEGMTVIEPDREAYRQATEGLVANNFPEIQDLYNRIVEEQ